MCGEGVGVEGQGHRIMRCLDMLPGGLVLFGQTWVPIYVVILLVIDKVEKWA